MSCSDREPGRPARQRSHSVRWSLSSRRRKGIWLFASMKFLQGCAIGAVVAACWSGSFRATTFPSLCLALGLLVRISDRPGRNPLISSQRASLPAVLSIKRMPRRSSFWNNSSAIVTGSASAQWRCAWVPPCRPRSAPGGCPALILADLRRRRQPGDRTVGRSRVACAGDATTEAVNAEPLQRRCRQVARFRR